MLRVIYNCTVCNGLVGTDGTFTCTCEAGPTAPPLQAAHELAGNGQGLSNPAPLARLEDV